MSFEMDREPRSKGNRIIDVIFWLLSIGLMFLYLYIGARDIAQQYPGDEKDDK